jgi:hypothetical protein
MMDALLLVLVVGVLVLALGVDVAALVGCCASAISSEGMRRARKSVRTKRDHPRRAESCARQSVEKMREGAPIVSAQGRPREPKSKIRRSRGFVLPESAAGNQTSLDFCCERYPLG